MDRKNFMIITGGVNVFPSSVETVLMEHAGIQEVAVVGVPHPEWGETVMAVIKPVSDAAPPDSASLARFCRQRLSKAECPKRFMFVDELPRSANGKVQKLEIRKWVCDQLAVSSVVEEFK
jgi:acyl-CoA synthetase (AMP-forming)/AMP-acid ligase II